MDISIFKALLSFFKLYLNLLLLILSVWWIKTLSAFDWRIKSEFFHDLAPYLLYPPFIFLLQYFLIFSFQLLKTKNYYQKNQNFENSFTYNHIYWTEFLYNWKILPPPRSTMRRLTYFLSAMWRVNSDRDNGKLKDYYCNNFDFVIMKKMG